MFNDLQYSGYILNIVVYYYTGEKVNILNLVAGIKEEVHLY
jgi:hypothetical protein